MREDSSSPRVRPAPLAMVRSLSRKDLASCTIRGTLPCVGRVIETVATREIGTHAARSDALGVAPDGTYRLELRTALYRRGRRLAGALGQAPHDGRPAPCAGLRAGHGRSSEAPG